MNQTQENADAYMGYVTIPNTISSPSTVDFAPLAGKYTFDRGNKSIVISNKDTSDGKHVIYDAVYMIFVS